MPRRKIGVGHEGFPDRPDEPTPWLARDPLAVLWVQSPQPSPAQTSVSPCHATRLYRSILLRPTDVESLTGHGVSGGGVASSQGRLVAEGVATEPMGFRVQPSASSRKISSDTWPPQIVSASMNI